MCLSSSHFFSFLFFLSILFFSAFVLISSIIFSIFFSEFSIFSPLGIVKIGGFFFPFIDVSTSFVSFLAPKVTSPLFILTCPCIKFVAVISAPLLRVTLSPRTRLLPTRFTSPFIIPLFST